MSSSPTLPMGTVVGGLEIRRILGHGGFGIVYEAYDSDLDRSVALKEYFLNGYARRDGLTVVPVNDASTEMLLHGRDRFLREARMLAMLHERAHATSSSLVIVHRVFQANQTAYMAMKMYHGATLRQRVGTDPGSITEDWVRGMVSSVLEALDALHSLPGENLVHRDVSPDNIIIQPDETPVLLDFGATRSTASEQTAMIFKPGFSPIEQYTDAFAQGPWTDLYALCATAYFAIFRQSPGEAMDRFAGKQGISAAQRGAAGFSEQFLAILDRGLAVLPQDRFQSVAQLREALAPQSDAGPARTPVARAHGPVNPTPPAPPWPPSAPEDDDRTRILGDVRRPEDLPVDWIGLSVVPADDDDATRVLPPQGQAGDVPLAGGRTVGDGAPPVSGRGSSRGDASDPGVPADQPPPLPPRQAQAPRSTGTPAPARPEVGGRRPRNRALRSAVAAGVIGAATLAVWQWQRPKPPGADSPPTPPRPVAAPVCQVDKEGWPCILGGLSQLSPAPAGLGFKVSPRVAMVGGRLDLELESPTDGFVYIFAVDDGPEAKAVLLFPRSDDLDNRVRAMSKLKLPRRPAWDVAVAPPLGRSWLMAVVTPRVVPEWSPAVFAPVGLGAASRSMSTGWPWQAFGLPDCVGHPECNERFAAVPVSFQVQ